MTLSWGEMIALRYYLCAKWSVCPGRGGSCQYLVWAAREVCQLGIPFELDIAASAGYIPTQVFISAAVSGPYCG